MADFSYSFQEFTDHLAAQDIVQQYQHVWTPGAGHIELTGEPNFMASSTRVMDYMRQLYPDYSEAFFKGSRFSMIMNFVAEEIDVLEDAGLAVQGSSDSLLSDAAWRALHQVFTAADFLCRKQNVTVQEVVELAKNYR